MDPTILDAARRAEIWVFDVDATLVDGMSATSLRPGALALLTALRASGRRVLAWSAGGEDYARRRLTATGIIDVIESVHGKGDRDADRWYDPAIAIDPADVTRAVFVDDQPGDLSPTLKVVKVRPYLAENPHDRELARIREAVFDTPDPDSAHTPS